MHDGLENAMSDFTTFGAMVALWIANAFLVIRIDKWVNDYTEIVLTGVVRGVRVPVGYRRRVLQTTLATNIAGQVGIASGLALGWILIGRGAAVEELQMLAYLFAFLNGVAALAWPLVFPFHYRYLESVLREAEPV
jgi:predicted secreted protein